MIKNKLRLLNIYLKSHNIAENEKMYYRNFLRGGKGGSTGASSKGSGEDG